MNYIIESLLVGTYTWFIYMLFSVFIKNLYMLLLVVGFFKHFLGSSLKIHSWYCNNGDACIKVLSQDQNYEANTIYLIRDSLLESILFLVVGVILSTFCNLFKSIELTNSILFFSIGTILHIAAEHLLVHKYFCKTTCTIEDSN
jgi:hypothetical protein